VVLDREHAVVCRVNTALDVPHGGFLTAVQCIRNVLEKDLKQSLAMAASPSVLIETRVKWKTRRENTPIRNGK
jgi:hypothetical protein